MTTKEVPPDGCHHYTSIGQVPWDLQKYWRQRFSIFSKYGDGIWMTDDAWFGITPEPVANKIADHLAQCTPPELTVLIDIFSGTGGNTIAFARSNRWEKVIAIEKDHRAILCAQRNARIYGVKNGIEWVEGDSFEMPLARNLAEYRGRCVIFASPPWGGPGYSSDPVFNLWTMQPYPLQRIYDLLTSISEFLVLYLPRTSDLRQLAALVKDDQKIMVTHYCMRGASKAICAYYGPFRE